MPATQESSAALSRCSLPASMFQPEPEQTCGVTVCQSASSLLRYHV